MTSMLDGLEHQLKQAKELVARRNQLVKLSSNRDFQKIINEDFIVGETARAAHESGDPLFDKKQQEDCASMAKAGGHLKRYLSLVMQFGNQAEEQIPELEAHIAEVRAGEDQIDDQTQADDEGDD